MVNVYSNITLNKAGNIGVHVRDNAVANVDSLSSPAFNSTDQIGYYLYGKGATANIGQAVMNDNGQDRTTIFRIALNVSSTRLILTTGDPGQVVATSEALLVAGI